MEFEKTRGFIENCRDITADGIFDLFTCVLDDAYRMAGVEQISEIPAGDAEVYLKALCRVVFAINASVRENEDALCDARSTILSRLAKGKEELELREGELLSHLRQMEDAVEKLKNQVLEKEEKLSALKAEREELLKRGIEAEDKKRELLQEMTAICDRNGRVSKEMSELSAKARLIISCWNSLCAGEQGVRILKEQEFHKIPDWFNEKIDRVTKDLSELSGKFGELVLYSEKLMR